MLLTPHTIVGITIATKIANPYLAVPIAFVSHFLGDLVPHWDFFSNVNIRKIPLKTFFYIIADIILGVTVGLVATLYAMWVLKDPQLGISIFLCGIAGVLPDAINGLELFDIGNKKGIVRKFANKILQIQGKLQIQAPLPWGIITQLFVVAFCALLIKDLIKL